MSEHVYVCRWCGSVDVHQKALVNVNSIFEGYSVSEWLDEDSYYCGECNVTRDEEPKAVRIDEVEVRVYIDPDTGGQWTPGNGKVYREV